MHKTILAAMLTVLAWPALAQNAEKPAVAANDTWTYQETLEKGTAWRQTRNEATVIRVGSSEILLSIKEAGSTVPPHEQLVGPDWSRFRNVNGKETVVNRPLNFPLSPGKTWRIEYTEEHPNREHSSEHFKSKYIVTGWENVTVPAGTFRAVKIEDEGEWTAQLAPDVSTASRTRIDSQGSTVVMQSNKVTPQTVTGRLYKAFWYAPEVKRMVKSVEEYYSASGSRSERHTEELLSYRVSQ